MALTPNNNDPLKQYNPDTQQWEGIKAGAISDGTTVITPNNVTAHWDDYVKHPGVGTTTNIGNAYSVTLSPVPIAYKNAMGLVLTINANSTGAATINVNGLGALPIKKANGLSVTNLKAGGVYTLRYSTGSFILQGEGGEYGSAGALQVLSGYTYGTDDGLVSGSMTNRGAHNLSFNNINGVAIPAGYHNGSGRVTMPISAGDHIIYTDSAFYSGSSETPSVRRRVTIQHAGVYRITTNINHGDSAGGQTVLCDVRVNGVLRRTFQQTNNYYVDHQVDLTLNAGDEVSLAYYRHWANTDLQWSTNKFTIGCNLIAPQIAKLQ